jgi:hypothetical protein
MTRHRFAEAYAFFRKAYALNPNEPRLLYAAAGVLYRAEVSDVADKWSGRGERVSGYGRIEVCSIRSAVACLTKQLLSLGKLPAPRFVGLGSLKSQTGCVTNKQILNALLNPVAKPKRSLSDTRVTASPCRRAASRCRGGDSPPTSESFIFLFHSCGSMRFKEGNQSQSHFEAWLGFPRSLAANVES